MTTDDLIKLLKQEPGINVKISFRNGGYEEIRSIHAVEYRVIKSDENVRSEVFVLLTKKD